MLVLNERIKFIQYHIDTFHNDIKRHKGCFCLIIVENGTRMCLQYG